MAKKQDQPEDRTAGFLRRIASSEALWLAGIPVTAYLAVYSYYSGYFSVFSLPRLLIEFNLVEVFFVSGVILAVAFLVFFYGNLAFSAVSGLPGILAKRLRRGIVIFVVFLGTMLVVQSPRYLRSLHWFVLAGILFVVVTELVLPLMTERRVKGYLNKLEAAEVAREKAEKDKTLRGPPEKLLILMGPWLGAAVFLLFCVYGLGKYQAVTRKDYYVTDETPTSVILWMGRERAISARFNPDTRILSSEFTVLELSQLPRTLRYEEVGPLEFEGDSASLPAIEPTQTPMPTINAPAETQTQGEQSEPTATKCLREH